MWAEQTKGKSVKNRIKNLMPEDPTPERYITRAEALEIIAKVEQLPADELEAIDKLWMAASAVVMLAAAAKVATPHPHSLIKTEEKKQEMLTALKDGVADFINLKMSEAAKAIGVAKLMLAQWQMNVDDCAAELMALKSSMNN